MNKPTVYIITAVHNPGKSIDGFLQCCVSQTYSPIKIVVVDDGSTDGTSDFIQSHYPEIILLRGNGKLWWGKSMYMATEKVLKIGNDDDYILYINDDCMFSTDYIKGMIDKSNHSDVIGSFGISLENKSSIIDGPSVFNWEAARLLPKYKNRTLSAIPRGKKIFSDTLTTRGTLYPLQAIQAVGNFDYKTFPHHTADIDMSLRVKEKDYNLVYYSDIFLYLDDNRTGIIFRTDTLTKPQRFKYLFNLFFSKKSAYSLFHRVAFIRRHIPSKYHRRFYKKLISEFILYSSNYWMIYYFKQLLRPLYLPLLKRR